MKSKKTQITLWSMILIIIATEFGFSNIITAYYQMSYASMIWYVICAVIFMFPLSMIFAEYSGSLKKDHGGFYTWLINSFGEKWAFIGTFVWVSSIIINILQNVSGMGINFSGMIYGKDYSGSWHLGPFNANELEAIMGIAAIIATTYFATKGLKKITVTAAIGGIISLATIGIFVISSLVIFFANHCRLAQPIHGVSSFIKSPSPAFQSPVAIMSFIVYAMFAYAGIESTGGFIDKMKNPRKSFPKAMIWVSVIMTALYVVGIFLCGFGVNWKKYMSGSNINLYNNSFMMMNALGEGLAKSFGLSASVGNEIGINLNRFLSFGSLIPFVGFMVVSTYAPIKGFIAGSSKDLWPRKFTNFNKYNLPSFAMWVECIIVVIVLALISIAGNTGQQFYTIITDMGNIGCVVPYYFIIVGFVFFKRRKDLERPIVFFHSKFTTYLTVIVLFAAITFGVIFNLIDPLMQHQYATAFWTFAGPIFFTFLAMYMYHLGTVHRAKRMIADNEAYERDSNR